MRWKMWDGFDVKMCGEIEGKQAVLVSRTAGGTLQIMNNPKLLGEIAMAIHSKLGLAIENVAFMAPTWDEPVPFVVALC
jgi:hypothetical protein